MLLLWLVVDILQTVLSGGSATAHKSDLKHKSCMCTCVSVCLSVFSPFLEVLQGMVPGKTWVPIRVDLCMLRTTNLRDFEYKNSNYTALYNVTMFTV